MIPASMAALARGAPRAGTFVLALQKVRAEPATLAAAWRPTGDATRQRRSADIRIGRARAISGARLNGSPRLHLRPIDLVVYQGPYQRVISSRRRLPA